jgi:CRISPR/Cas system-associated protein Csm6
MKDQMQTAESPRKVELSVSRKMNLPFMQRKPIRNSFELHPLTARTASTRTRSTKQDYEESDFSNIDK